MRMKLLGVVVVGLLMAARSLSGDAAGATVIPTSVGRNVIIDVGGQPGGGSLRMRMAQSELKREGLYGGKVDGVAGPATIRGIIEFQQREGLQQTTRLDTATRDRMTLNALRMNSWSGGTTRSNIGTGG
jgi:peptidoglycan hydrolase-like protein with peptidoglycan-binding domain